MSKGKGPKVGQKLAVSPIPGAPELTVVKVYPCKNKWRVALMDDGSMAGWPCTSSQ